jgi:hypothetical protein
MRLNGGPGLTLNERDEDRKPGRVPFVGAGAASYMKLHDFAIIRAAKAGSTFIARRGGK